MTKKEFLEQFVLTAIQTNEYWNVDHIFQWGLKAWNLINE